MSTPPARPRSPARSLVDAAADPAYRDGVAASRDRSTLHPFWDRAIRFLARNPSHLRALIRLCDPELAAHLDFGRMRLMEGSFIDERYRGAEVDLLVQMPYRSRGHVRVVTVYLLLEHQSKVDDHVLLRILGYLQRFWEADQRVVRGRSRKPAPVIAVVFYTGRSAWRPPRTFHDYLDWPPELLRWAPNFDILFLGLRDVSPEQLQSVGPIGWALRAAQRVHADAPEFADVMGRAFRAIDSLLMPEWKEIAQFLALMVVYRRPKAEHRSLLTEFAKRSTVRKHREEFTQMIKSYAEEMRDEGRDEGRVEGRVETLCDVILRLGRLRFGEPRPVQRRQIETLHDVSRLQSLSDRLLAASSWSELLAANGAGKGRNRADSRATRAPR